MFILISYFCDIVEPTIQATTNTIPAMLTFLRDKANISLHKIILDARMLTANIEKKTKRKLSTNMFYDFNNWCDDADDNSEEYLESCLIDHVKTIDEETALISRFTVLVDDKVFTKVFNITEPNCLDQTADFFLIKCSGANLIEAINIVKENIHC